MSSFLDGIHKLAALDLAANVIEGRADLLRFRRADQAHLGEHLGVSLAGQDVVLVQAAVEADRLRESFDAIVGVAGEAATQVFGPYRFSNGRAEGR